MIFDARAVRLHRDRAARTIVSVADVLAQLATELLDRLEDTKTVFSTALDLGGRGAIAPALIARNMTVFSADVSARMAARAGGLPVAIDGDALPLADKKFDLIIAHLSLHWTNDLPGALIQLRRALKPGGLFLASMPVLGTLAELRAAFLHAEHDLTGAVNPRISPFPDLRDCAGLLQRAGFSSPVADVQETRLIYATPLKLLHELRAAGETNAVLARARGFAPRDLFRLALASLARPDQKLDAILKMAIMTGWAS